MVSAAFLFRSGGEPTIRVFGQKLTAQPVTVGQADPGAAIRAYSPEAMTVFTVPMEIGVRGHTEISVSGGNMQVFDSEGISLLYEGEAFGTEDDVRIFWTVVNNEAAARFEMFVEDEKTAYTVSLTCDGGREWKIRKVRN